MILFINSCVRKDSRTKRLADFVIKKLMEKNSGQIVEEVVLKDIDFSKTDEQFINERDSLINAEDFSNPKFALARQFAQADTVVIAAPYWDLSFPAMLKQYFEKICVRGVTFVYTESGAPKGLCKAEKLYYVSTAGGPFYEEDFGYGYVKKLALSYYGIKDFHLIKACSLDVIGADVEKILSSAEQDALKEL